MPETATPPAPTTTETAATPAGKTNFGAKFRQAMATQTPEGETTATPPPAKKDEAPTPEKKEDAPTAAEKKATEKPTKGAKKTALDLALGTAATKETTDDTTTPPAAEEEHKDVTAEFDDKNPDWKRAREVMRTQSEEKKSLRAELETLRAEVGKGDPKTAEALQGVTRERDELKAKHDELLDIVTRLNVEYSPEFRQKYFDGRQKEVERAIGRVKQFGGDIEAFTEALELPEGRMRTAKLKEALENVDELDKPRVLSVLETIQKLDDEAAELKANPKKSFEELETQRNAERQRQAEEAQRLQKQEFDRISRSLGAKSPLLRTVDPTSEGGKEWNDEVKTAVAEAEKLFGPDTPFDTLVERAVKGTRYDSLEKLFLNTRKELVDAQTRLQEYEGASPDLHPSGRRAAETTEPKKPGERYREALNAGRSNIQV